VTAISTQPGAAQAAGQVPGRRLARLLRGRPDDPAWARPALLALMLATALLYLSPSWPDISEGCLRFLNRIDDIDDLAAPEIKPVYGNFVVFRRADNSFHGHLPHEGERRVIQIAWLTSEDEKLRKTQRGKFSRVFKKLFGSLDRKFGAGRDKNAAHKD